MPGGPRPGRAGAGSLESTLRKGCPAERAREFSPPAAAKQTKPSEQTQTENKRCGFPQGGERSRGNKAPLSPTSADGDRQTSWRQRWSGNAPGPSRSPAQPARGRPASPELLCGGCNRFFPKAPSSETHCTAVSGARYHRPGLRHKTSASPPRPLQTLRPCPAEAPSDLRRTSWPLRLHSAAWRGRPSRSLPDAMGRRYPPTALSSNEENGSPQKQLRGV